MSSLSRLPEFQDCHEMWCKERKRLARQSEHAQRSSETVQQGQYSQNASLPPPPPLPTLSASDKDKAQQNIPSGMGSGFMTGSFLGSSKATLSQVKSNYEQGRPPGTDLGIAGNFMPQVNFQTGQSYQQSGGFMGSAPQPYYQSNETAGNNSYGYKSSGRDSIETNNSKSSHYPVGGQGNPPNRPSQAYYEQLSPATADTERRHQANTSNYSYKALLSQNKLSEKDSAYRDSSKPAQNIAHQVSTKR